MVMAVYDLRHTIIPDEATAAVGVLAVLKLVHTYVLTRDFGAAVVTFGDLGDGECLNSNSAWAAWVNLRDASTTAWCVDSTGQSVSIPKKDSSVDDLFSCQ